MFITHMRHIKILSYVSLFNVVLLFFLFLYSSLKCSQVEGTAPLQEIPSLATEFSVGNNQISQAIENNGNCDGNFRCKNSRREPIANKKKIRCSLATELQQSSNRNLVIVDHFKAKYRRNILLAT